ncbi:unnamed protein product [Linum trigynum]|uniref:Uncharacterized protein n=1 Tax=Linum trigynum TaxID=586398 RepID=A0AAV2CDR0_9ROSI
MTNRQRSITNYKYPRAIVLRRLESRAAAAAIVSPILPTTNEDCSDHHSRFLAAVRVSQSTPRSNRRLRSLEIVWFPAVVRLSQPSLRRRRAPPAFVHVPWSSVVSPTVVHFSQSSTRTKMVKGTASFVFSFAN